LDQGQNLESVRKVGVVILATHSDPDPDFQKLVGDEIVYDRFLSFMEDEASVLEFNDITNALRPVH